MDWMKIMSAVFLGAMLENSPQAKPGDWTSALIPIFGVLGFVLLLMSWV